MSLLIQLRSLLYFFLMGVGYSFLLAYVLCILHQIKHLWWKHLIEFSIHLLFTLILYAGLIQVNQGILHLYFLVSLTLGFLCGYIIYQPLVLPYAMRFVHWIKKRHQKNKSKD